MASAVAPVCGAGKGGPQFHCSMMCQFFVHFHTRRVERPRVAPGAIACADAACCGPSSCRSSQLMPSRAAAAARSAPRRPSSPRRQRRHRARLCGVPRGPAERWRPALGRRRRDRASLRGRGGARRGERDRRAARVGGRAARCSIVSPARTSPCAGSTPRYCAARSSVGSRQNELTKRAALIRSRGSQIRGPAAQTWGVAAAWLGAPWPSGIRSASLHTRRVSRHGAT